MTHLSLDLISPPEFQACISNYRPDLSTPISNRYVKYISNMPKMEIFTFPYPLLPKYAPPTGFPISVNGVTILQLFKSQVENSSLYPFFPFYCTNSSVKTSDCSACQCYEEE